MKNLIDTFLFFNETDLLKVRLEYLGNEVDYFIIAEANIDFSGKPKKFHLKDRISTLPFAEKIIYYPIEINLYSLKWILKRLRWITRPHKFLWKIQDAQRNIVQKVIRQKNVQADYVLFGDLDEIPNLALIQSIRKDEVDILEPKSLRQRLFYYRPDIATDYEGWFGTICSPYKNFFDFLPHQLRSKRENLAFLENGGYHLSYFMSPKDMKTKIMAIADVERVQASKQLTTEEIEKYILENKDLFGRDLGFVRDKNLLPYDLKKLINQWMPWTKD